MGRAHLSGDCYTTVSRSLRIRWNISSIRQTPWPAGTRSVSPYGWSKGWEEQGITIDVAYRYFATPAKKIYYCRYPRTYTVYPEYGYRSKYCRSCCNTDWCPKRRIGTNDKTYLHSVTIDIRHIIFCINKMDMINYSETVFLNIKSEVEALVKNIGIWGFKLYPYQCKIRWQCSWCLRKYGMV